MVTINSHFNKSTVIDLRRGYLFNLGPLFVNISDFEVHNKTTATFGATFDQSSGWGWAAFERNMVGNIPLLSNAPQLQPQNRFPSFLCQNAHCNMKVCTSNPDFEIRLPAQHFKYYKLWKKFSFISRWISYLIEFRSPSPYNHSDTTCSHIRWQLVYQ